MILESFQSVLKIWCDFASSHLSQNGHTVVSILASCDKQTVRSHSGTAWPISVYVVTCETNGVWGKESEERREREKDSRSQAQCIIPFSAVRAGESGCWHALHMCQCTKVVCMHL